LRGAEPSILADVFRPGKRALAAAFCFLPSASCLVPEFDVARASCAWITGGTPVPLFKLNQYFLPGLPLFFLLPFYFFLFSLPSAFCFLPPASRILLLSFKGARYNAPRHLLWT